MPSFVENCNQPSCADAGFPAAAAGEGALDAAAPGAAAESVTGDSVFAVGQIPAKLGGVMGGAGVVGGCGEIRSHTLAASKAAFFAASVSGRTGGGSGIGYGGMAGIAGIGTTGI